MPERRSPDVLKNYKEIAINASESVKNLMRFYVPIWIDM